MPVTGPDLDVFCRRGVRLAGVAAPLVADVTVRLLLCLIRAMCIPSRGHSAFYPRATFTIITLIVMLVNNLRAGSCQNWIENSIALNVFAFFGVVVAAQIAFCHGTKIVVKVEFVDNLAT